jgi:hypothetical protein
MKINLLDTTFIIPVFYDSADRVSNAAVTLQYLCKHLHTNILIYEYGPVCRTPTILNQINTEGSNIEVIYEEGSGIFHRTKYLNAMLRKATTPVCVNYDVDVLLQPDTYVKARNRILEGVDLHYPYFLGLSQKKVNFTGREKLFNAGLLWVLASSDWVADQSEYGHCQFFSSDSYRNGGAENEQFTSYGPEDAERAYRFQKLGYQVEWGSGYVYHLEHSRGVNSNSENPHFRRNNQLFEYIKTLTVEELKAYYENYKKQLWQEERVQP